MDARFHKGSCKSHCSCTCGRHLHHPRVAVFFSEVRVAESGAASAVLGAAVRLQCYDTSYNRRGKAKAHIRKRFLDACKAYAGRKSNSWSQHYRGPNITTSSHGHTTVDAPTVLLRLLLDSVVEASTSSVVAVDDSMPGLTDVLL